MVKCGFIVEGDSEIIVFKSKNLNDIFYENELECVGIYSADGRDNIIKCNGGVESKVKILLEKGAEVIFIIMDLEKDDCIVKLKTSCHEYFSKQYIIILVQALEAWFLADSITLSSVLKKNFYYEEPEETTELPYEVIKEEFMNSYKGRGPGSKVSLSRKMIREGFSFENILKHPNCKSAKYFSSKLKSLKNYNE
ncbi:MAG: hypothetical protein COT22_14095 [Ignavibacteria bacterium CG08_land_8_20_14_0_20_37_9]|nr:MAG: hypothetical protein AUJ54_09815 [Ignavibacteria bacterium CG1_02_37_35]PIS43769.1 MAG: hypothetical protein COT22_14095 [Ignavibacteria bacterium CG08_land_8_20_14_0_20_37_9]PIX94935.1 MAG: hypothetical protein COZ25_03050 [Ignavibacteria bacterium CG_4_10_14_3_um_filter_37_18]PJC60628.1 MAG: hypothetical protein CO025_02695 [Ignavibacteria bacterium CG_4_9_14_0_2_um_filter_37_13]